MGIVTRRTSTRIIPHAVFGAILLFSSAALAQGCAMCKANAAATDAKSQRALNRAILVMVLPPVALMLAGAAFARHYARQRDSAKN